MSVAPPKRTLYQEIAHQRTLANESQNNEEMHDWRERQASEVLESMKKSSSASASPQQETSQVLRNNWKGNVNSSDAVDNNYTPKSNNKMWNEPQDVSPPEVKNPIVGSFLNTTDRQKQKGYHSYYHQQQQFHANETPRPQLIAPDNSWDHSGNFTSSASRELTIPRSDYSLMSNQSESSVYYQKRGNTRHIHKTYTENDLICGKTKGEMKFVLFCLGGIVLFISIVLLIFGGVRLGRYNKARDRVAELAPYSLQTTCEVVTWEKRSISCGGDSPNCCYYAYLQLQVTAFSNEQVPAYSNFSPETCGGQTMFTSGETIDCWVQPPPVTSKRVVLMLPVLPNEDDKSSGVALLISGGVILAITWLGGAVVAGAFLTG